MSEKLSDNQIGDLLESLRLQIEPCQAETDRGDTTLRAANMALLSLQLGLVHAEAEDEAINDAIIDPTKLPPSPSRD